MADVVGFLEEVFAIKDPELIEVLKKDCVIDIYERGTSINTVGRTDYYVRFLVDGVVRGFIIDSHFKEITTSFIFKRGDIIAGSMMLDGSPSEIGFKVVRRTRVLSVPIETIKKTRLKFSEIIDLQMSMLAKSSLYHWETKKMLYLKTSRDRYMWFLKHYPGLVDVVNHSDIASFLNMTPVTLSRIRHTWKPKAI